MPCSRIARVNARAESELDRVETKMNLEFRATAEPKWREMRYQDSLNQDNGGYHQPRTAADARKDRDLARLGYRVLRLEAALVMRHLPVALARIAEAIAEAVAEPPLDR